MNAVELLLQSPPMRALGWTLVHFLWQGVALLAVHEVLQAMLRRGSSQQRYLTSCLVLLAMLVSAAVTLRIEMQSGSVGAGSILPQGTQLGIPAQGASQQTAREGATPPVVVTRLSDPHITPPQLSVASDRNGAVDPTVRQRLRSAVVQPIHFLQARFPRLEDVMPWFVSLWFLGVFLLTTRLAIGWQEANWLRTRAVRPVDDHRGQQLQALVRRLRISRPVQVLESSLAEVPTVVGWLRPVVLIPTAALTGLAPQHLEALLAHELTHVKRHDYLVNLLQTMVETLLFYHPAIWWVSNRIRVERENCCDDVAVQVCGDTLLYARALTTMEELRRQPLRPELAMAANGASLVQRVRRLVGRGGEPRTPGTGVVAAAILIALSSLLAVSADRTTEARVLDDTASRSAPVVAEPSDVAPVREPDSEQANLDVLGGKSAKIEEAQPAPQLPRPVHLSHKSRRAEPQQDRLELADLLQLKQSGVDPDYRHEMIQRFGELDVEELVALRLHDVDAQYVEEMAEVLGTLEFEELLSLKIHDVDAEYVVAMNQAFDEELETQEIAHLKQQGVEDCDVRDMHAQGQHYSPEEIIEFERAGMDPEFAEDLEHLGYDDVSVHDMVQLARMGIDIDVMEDLIDALGPLTLEEVVALLTLGIDSNEIEDLQEMGMSRPSPELLVRMFAVGLTADVVDTILDDNMDRIPVETLLQFKELGLEEVFFPEFRRRNE